MSSTTMNALVLHAVGDARLESIPRPQLEDDHVIVRVNFCGVCGSDIPRVFVKGTYSFPTVCGHEFAGVVEECGRGVDDVAVGRRVAVFPLLWCDNCPACERGKFVQCYNYDYIGSRRDGAFAEYVMAPRKNLLTVPDSVSLEEAAMTEPASVALHALRRGGGCAPGETVAIFGAGPIGLMVAQWARAMGASNIFLFDIVPEKLALAKSFGFTSVFDSRHEKPIEQIHAQTRGQGVHLSFESAGVPTTMLQALEATCRGGRMVVLGNPSGDVTLPAPLLSQLIRREVQIFGTWNSDFSPHGNDDDWHTTLEAMASKTIKLKPLITHRIPLSNALDALRMMKAGKEFYSKVLIHP